MIKVYFENKEKNKSERVAIFKDEYTYMDNIKALEQLSKDSGFGTVTESEEQRVDLDQMFLLSDLLSNCRGLGDEQMKNLGKKLTEMYA